MLIGPLADIRDGEAVLDEHQLEKQPDWSFDAVDSGQSPAARFHEQPERRPHHAAPCAGRGGRARRPAPAHAGGCTRRWRFPRSS